MDGNDRGRPNGILVTVCVAESWLPEPLRDEAGTRDLVPISRGRLKEFLFVTTRRPPSTSSRYVLRAPYGVRVKDLGVEELVTILRRLG